MVRETLVLRPHNIQPGANVHRVPLIRLSLRNHVGGRKTIRPALLRPERSSFKYTDHSSHLARRLFKNKP